MVPTNRKEISLYEEAKAGLSSLIQQIATVFVGFIIMLLITGGAPSSLIIAVSFCVGTAFVAWSEQRRVGELTTTVQRTAPEFSPTSSDLQQEPASKQASIVKNSELMESIEDSTENVSDAKSEQSRVRAIYKASSDREFIGQGVIACGGNIVGSIAGGNSIRVFLNGISSNVTNAINQLPNSSQPEESNIKNLLLQLQAAIESEPELGDEDKAMALEQVQALAEACQDPKQVAMQKVAKAATVMLRGIVAGLPEQRSW